ncbi:hypothetical protein KBZ94_41515 [Streptomyces sp. RM72]|uniref:hypothetical protein n=1 Tax=Streptomyces sp. RM72 TaxID=1115510 RepID=UPI001B396335|nr:hypothetical protein [Streptomyces sp. RM72]MBQ0891312.1 hypothetical protein [Streptomyces sp. RM72]
MSATRWTIRLLCVVLVAVEIAAAATGHRELMYAAVLAMAAVTAVVWAVPSKDER